MALEEARNSFRFSTDGLPEGERAKAVRELYERTTLPGKIEPLEPLPDCTVRAEITKRAFPGLGVIPARCADYAKPPGREVPSPATRTNCCSP